MNPFNLLSLLHEFLADQCGIYSIRNYFEIGIISLAIYKVLKWMNHNHTPNVMISTYAYSGLILTSFMLGLQNLNLFLWIALPIVSLIVVLLEQKQIQKNFIFPSSRYITIAQRADPQWLDLLIRAHLLAAYQKKEIFCILEQTYALQTITQSNCLINAPINQDLLNIIFKSNGLDTPCIITINQHGAIQMINASLKQHIADMIVVKTEHPTAQYMHTIANKTDAIAWTINPETKHTTVWHNQTKIESINIDQLAIFCKKIINHNQTKKGPLHGIQTYSHSTKSFMDQNQ